MAADTTPWADGALVALSWITTYLLHSSLLLGAVWLLQRAWRGLPDAVQEALWKTALLGGLLTTTWQIGFGAEPYAGTVQLARPAAAVDLLPAPLALPGSDRAGPSARRGDPAPRLPAALPPAEPTRDAAPALDATAVALCLYGAIVLLGLAHLALGRLRLQAQLRSRDLIVDGELPAQLLRLVHRAHFGRAVRLTHSDRIPTPIAFGTVQPEICVPSRALAELQPDELESMLAHELAHLVHRDPAWLLACQLLERVLFVQPLHRLARRHLQRLAEYRCDAWAAQNACSGTSLARCLVEVARWIAPAQPVAVHAAGMASNRSLLWQRVGRILEGPAARPRPVASRLAAAALLAFGATALPAASWTGPAPDTGNRDALPELIELAPAPGLQALSEELDALHGELASLRRALAGAPPDPETEALIDRLERYAEQLSQRHADMQAMLPATLDALAADAPGRSDSVSNREDQKREDR